MNEQEQFWAGEFGDAYLQRNQVNWMARVQFWADILAYTNPNSGPNSVLEVGTNAGWNLRALRVLRPLIDVTGVDVNEKALAEARACFIPVHNMTAEEVGTAWPGKFDIVFTSGVLIHIPPASIHQAMESIVKASRRYVLCIEYEADKEEEVNYRGHSERLWRRPYRKMYEEMGLKTLFFGSVTKDDGFDNCQWAVLGKV